jgi:MFS family permease
MTETLEKSLRHSAAARWTTMAVVSFTMLCGYFVADVAAPLKPLIESQLHWDSEQYGFFTSAYGWFNVFLFMLVLGGMILDKMGPRFAGLLATGLMLVGCAVKWYAFSTQSLAQHTLFGQNMQVMLASLGFATFGVGIELCGITATKIISRWFKGYEIALAMGLQVAIARIGTGIALGASAPIAKVFGSVSAPVLGGALLLGVGLVAYLFYIGMDKKLDSSEGAEEKTKSEDGFRLADIKQILTNRGFWLIALLCALFYSGVFPFLKYATDLMVQKFHVSPDYAGLIPSMLPFGTMILTPVFGRIYDKKGKGATIMILGSLLIVGVHVLFALPFLTHWLVAIVAMLILGVGFSLVPSAMWPSVPKLIPQRQLGTAYALIFYLQNLIALMGVPYLVGFVLDRYSATKTVVNNETVVAYDYTYPMLIFVACGVLAVLVALLLKSADKKDGYGLELPNQTATEEADAS